MAEQVTVHLRFFAAARSAAGIDGRAVAGPAPLTIASALVLARSSAADYDPVMARCSFLVNAVATTDRGHALSDGDTLDVLPPFAGG